ncbi:MAG TPA: BON domain-containing protein [Terriglobales bacterium]|nr:BON domain-containing protein [Terriglobales bacterium]
MQASRPFCRLALVFLFLRFPAYAQTGASGSRYDAQIQQDLDKVARSKRQYNGIKATTEDQAVTLSGDVNLYIFKASLARRVEKLKDVRNHVQVDGTVADDQLRHSLADRLRYDRVAFGTAFNAVSLTVVNGVATPGGVVHDYPSRDSALAIVETTPVVKDVVGNTDVPPTSSVHDDLRVRTYRATYGGSALEKYATDPQKPIPIVVEMGRVTLSGMVNNDADKKIAGIRAKQVSGVFHVDNQLLALGQTNK